MSEEFKNWISNKKFEIFDKINETSNKDTNDSIVVSNDMLKTSDIRVYNSKVSIIESIINNKINEITKTSDIVFKWLNDTKLRRQVIQGFNDLVHKYTKVLELLEINSSGSTIKVAANRVQNLLKNLKYALNNEIFNYPTGSQYRNVKHSVIKICDSQSFILKVVFEVMPCLVSGIPVILVTEAKTSIGVSYLMDLWEKAGLESGIIQLVITDNKNIENVNKSTQPLAVPLHVVFESADIECGIDRIINSRINDTIVSINVFVQQSIYKKFCDQMKTRVLNAIEIGDRFDANADIVSKVNVNYEAIDFDNENKSFDIQVFKFRTNDEMKSLVNHFTAIPYISLWAEKTSLALEFASILNSSSNVYINSSLKFPVKSENYLFDNVLDKIDVKTISVVNTKLFESMIASNKNWKTTSEEEREQTIKKFVFAYENTLLTPDFQALNRKIVENKDSNGIQLTITSYEAIGLIVAKINDKFDDKIFAFILEALISGNSVVVIGSKQIPELLALKEYLHSSGKDIFQLIDAIDCEIADNAVLTVGNKTVGLYLKQLENTSRKSYLKFSKSISLCFGDISFGK